MINKNPITGRINSSIRLDRDSENRTFDFNSNITNVKIKNYDIGELNLKVFGNTDYNSYAVNLDLSKKGKELENWLFPKKYISKLNTNKITLEEHNLALEGFKKSYLDAKNKINGVKTNIPPAGEGTPSKKLSFHDGS